MYNCRKADVCVSLERVAVDANGECHGRDINWLLFHLVLVNVHV
jgi:hypothetical protein